MKLKRGMVMGILWMIMGIAQFFNRLLAIGPQMTTGAKVWYAVGFVIGLAQLICALHVEKKVRRYGVIGIFAFQIVYYIYCLIKNVFMSEMPGQYMIFAIIIGAAFIGIAASGIWKLSQIGKKGE